MKSSPIVMLIALLYLICNQSIAQTKAPQPAKLNHIAVYVSDLNKSASFYQDLFQLLKIEEPFKDGKHVWFSLGNAGQMHLIKGENAKLQHNKNEHLCFSVLSIDDFITRLTKGNIEYENWEGNAKAPTLRVDGVKQVYFQDPDGHWLEVNDAL